MTVYEDDDPCKASAPTTTCRLCGQPLEPDMPWIDWRWGDHDGCGYCGPQGHDSVQPFHEECVEALFKAYDHPTVYPPDEPDAILSTWLRPTLWKTVWMPDRVTVQDAMLAHTVYSRIALTVGFDGSDDPADLNPFKACEWIFDDMGEFRSKYMIPYAKSLGLDRDEAGYLTSFLVDGRMLAAPDWVRDATKEQLADRVRRMAADPYKYPLPMTVEPADDPSIWDLI
ncbi:hypothetical protein [Bifidobacterium sp. SO1]|uniref:hypothetical protein n=1 Tax=Bifidobacterium sp. SO1 TaxID=2809029 RepID=UPI001BDD5CD6|nr:hypothetical protein [Bifidobacterium sp. SO1]MBT1162942.1 hypothetical protein [Bifidobacterium sp. SO1]